MLASQEGTEQKMETGKHSFLEIPRAGLQVRRWRGRNRASRLGRPGSGGVAGGGGGRSFQIRRRGNGGDPRWSEGHTDGRETAGKRRWKNRRLKVITQTEQCDRLKPQGWGEPERAEADRQEET